MAAAYRDSGRYPALYGADVATASLTTPPTGHCRECAALARQPAAAPPASGVAAVVAASGGVAMTVPNGAANGTGRHSGLAGSRPVVLLRLRPRHTDAGTPVVHLAPLPDGAPPIALTALCGTLLHPDAVERVAPGEGVPCSQCLVSQAGTLPAEALATAEAPDPGPAAAASTYREWGWPVLLRRDQVWLALGTVATALMVPAALCARTAALLTERHCPPAMFGHPYAPDHQVLLAGEQYEVALPWPPGVHRVAAGVLLPPSATPRGPLTWTRAPAAERLGVVP